MNRYFILITIALILILAISGCTTKLSEEPGSEASGAVENGNKENITAIAKKIDAETAKKMIDTDEVTIVDVRSAAEYADGHVPGAILAPLNELPANAETILPNKDATLLIYCRSGNRSAQAVNILRQLGYTRLYDFGGIMSWPYEIEKGQ